MLRDLDTAIIEDRLVFGGGVGGNRLRLSLCFVTGVTFSSVTHFINSYLIDTKGVRYIVYDDKETWIIVIAENSGINSEFCGKIREEYERKVYRRGGDLIGEVNFQAITRRQVLELCEVEYNRPSPSLKVLTRDDFKKMTPPPLVRTLHYNKYGEHSSSSLIELKPELFIG
jgi:hypothetical protein